ncbi:TetR/AcrR family transcriptional regulator [Alicyclobacillus dauci]|uniref:TetR/AcrR family transcriptional regulator n=1 Tax=Alicyclobacillus dauci TaxID=1475485 RepID=A0ABY6Z950_9BACL|nr:TetR/AcrR family transcriptional regulator [Alicyclobacillus dauci]WAH39402.1 TetR/AcrR family transcriptional regulator [Alicyclobacillus dauci]
MFETEGYRNVSMEDIGRKSGIARTTMYEYFSNKDQVLFALVEEIAEALHSGPGAGDTCLERLEKLAAIYLRKIATNQSLYLLLFQESPALSDELSTKLLTWRREQFLQVVGIAEDAFKSGELRSEIKVEDVGFLFQAVVGQRAGELLMTRQQVNPDEEAHRLVQLLWWGVGSVLPGGPRDPVRIPGS